MDKRPMNVGFFTLVVGAVVASTACSYRPSGGGRIGPATTIFEAAVRNIATGSNGAVRIDSRIMDSIPTRFDFERDVVIAPTPTLLVLPGEERQRQVTLARLRIRPERIEDYTACTPHIGGVPVDRPGATPEWRAAADSARRACAARATYGVAILGLPRRTPDAASWKIRVYFVSAESRQIHDLLLIQNGGTWTVVSREELLSVSS